MNIGIASRLAALREQSGLSREELANRLGVGVEDVSQWERGESSPDADDLVGLAKLYGISLDELIKTEPAAAEDGAGDEDAREAHGESPWKFQRKDGGIDFRKFPYPVAVLIAYLLIGFLLDLWHPGWMLFLTIPVYYTACSSSGGFDLNRVPYPLLVSILYLVAGFAKDLWHPGWLIFLTIPLYYTLAGRVIQEKVNRVLVEVLLVGIVYLIGMSLGHWFRVWLVVPAVAFILIATIRERRGAR